MMSEQQLKTLKGAILDQRRCLNRNDMERWAYQQTVIDAIVKEATQTTVTPAV